LAPARGRLSRRAKFAERPTYMSGLSSKFAPPLTLSALAPLHPGEHLLLVSVVSITLGCRLVLLLALRLLRLLILVALLLLVGLLAAAGAELVLAGQPALRCEPLVETCRVDGHARLAGQMLQVRRRRRPRSTARLLGRQVLQLPVRQRVREEVVLVLAEGRRLAAVAAGRRLERMLLLASEEGTLGCVGRVRRLYEMVARHCGRARLT